ncbi:MAG TPA: LEA type 2 family protein [Gemmatimonadaceae bacterium]|nr:LEA type 2 family protein [Gemmatimonadaceae bacterium]
MRRLSLVAAVAVAGTITACATLGRGALKDPVVTLKDVRVNGIGFNGGSVDIVLNVYNPNHFDLDATRVTYKLFVDTIPLGTGATDTKLTVTQGDTTQVPLPLSFTWAGAGQAARSLMNTGTVNYRVIGDITVGSAYGTLTLPYDRTGRFSSLGGSGRE